MSQAELARQLGLTPAAVVKLKKRGMPVSDVEAARRWRAAHVAPYVRATAPAAAPPAAAPAAAPIADDGGLNLAVERARLARAQREGQEMRNALLRGQYAPIGFVTEVLAAVSAEFAQRLEALPADIRKRCPSLPPEALDALAEALAAGRNAMADALEAAGARAAATAHYEPPTPAEGAA